MITEIAGYKVVGDSRHPDKSTADIIIDGCANSRMIVSTFTLNARMLT